MKVMGTLRLTGKTFSGLNVLVTGADGFIGSHLVEHLFALGANVTALCFHHGRDGRGWLDAVPTAVRRDLRVIRGDVRDHALVHRVLADQDTVFHLAALVSVRQSHAAAQSFIETNVLGTLNVLEAARDFRVRRIVHTSTGDVYGPGKSGLPVGENSPLRPQSPYEASKIAADMLVEAYARSYGLPAVTLRPFETFGPRQSDWALVPSIIRQFVDPSVQTIDAGDPAEARDLTFVTDVVTAFLAVAVADQVDYGRAYNAGSGTARSVREILELVRPIIGTEKPLSSNTWPAAVAAPPASPIADTASFELLTGWRPLVSFEEGVARTVRWWQGRLAAGEALAEARHGT